MNFRLEVVCINDNGDEQRGEVLKMERCQLAMETLGLTLSESRVLLENVQDFVVARQAAEDLRQRRSCPNCRERYTSKSGGTIEVKTLFGAVEVANPRWNRCQCEGKGAEDVPARDVMAPGPDKPGTALLGDQVGLLDSVRKGGRAVARGVAAGCSEP